MWLGIVRPEGNWMALFIEYNLIVKPELILIIAIVHEFQTLKLVECCSFNHNDMCRL